MTEPPFAAFAVLVTIWFLQGLYLRRDRWRAAELGPYFLRFGVAVLSGAAGVWLISAMMALPRGAPRVAALASAFALFIYGVVLLFRTTAEFAADQRTPDRFVSPYFWLIAAVAVLGGGILWLTGEHHMSLAAIGATMVGALLLDWALWPPKAWRTNFIFEGATEALGVGGVRSLLALVGLGFIAWATFGDPGRLFQ